MKWIAQHTILLSLLLVCVGVICILCSELHSEGLWGQLLREFGIVFVSVFTVSLLYEQVLAHRHFSRFRDEMIKVLQQMDNVQSTCTRLGIREIFESRSEYERKYDMVTLFDSVRPGGRILVVARTLFHFYNKREAIEKALLRGARIDIACLGSRQWDPVLAHLAWLKPSDMQAPLECLSDIVKWIDHRKPPGSLEIRAYRQPLPDSLLYIEKVTSEVLVWDLTFGRDLRDKKVLLFEPFEMNLGMRLFQRYEKVWDSAQVVLKILPGGAVQINKLAALVSGCVPSATAKTKPTATELSHFVPGPPKGN